MLIRKQSAASDRQVDRPAGWSPWRTWLILLAATAIQQVVLPASSLWAAKPAPPPPPAPVKFALSIVPEVGQFNVYDVNSSGTIVGQVGSLESAFVVIGPQVIYLNDAFVPPDGWYFASARGINESGSIVGTLGRFDASINDVRRGFVIHPQGWSTGSFDVLPYEISDYVSGMDINDDGTILATFKQPDGTFGAYVLETALPGLAPEVLPLPPSYHLISLINNSVDGRAAQIAGATLPPGASSTSTSRTYWRYTLGTSSPLIKSFSQSWFYPTGLNDDGSFCFGAVRPKPGNKSQYMAARYSDVLGYQTFSDSTYTAHSINNAGDMGISSSTAGVTAQLYSQGLGVLKLNDLLLGDPAEVQLFRSGRSTAKLTERGALNSAVPGFPGIVGSLSLADGTVYIFILTPTNP